MTTIHSPVDLPRGLLMMYQVSDTAEAAQVANGRKSYLYRSHIINCLYLFIPVEGV